MDLHPKAPAPVHALSQGAASHPGREIRKLFRKAAVFVINLAYDLQ
jgi:hypothetical protein